MITKSSRSLGAAAAVVIASGLLAAAGAASNAKSTAPDTGRTGTHAEEYRGNTSTPSAAPGNRTSTGRELTGPGAQPGEYRAPGSGPGNATFDTVHNVRIDPRTPNPDSVKPSPSGKAKRDSVRGSSGTTRPVGEPPRPTTPRTPSEMPGSGSGGGSRPGGGSGVPGGAPTR
jgi:hypothetical protein